MTYMLVNWLIKYLTLFKSDFHWINRFNKLIVTFYIELKRVYFRFNGDLKNQSNLSNYVNLSFKYPSMLEMAI